MLCVFAQDTENGFLMNANDIKLFKLRHVMCVAQDMENGFLMNANDQISLVCSKLKNDSKLASGFNAIGFSQGGQFL